MYSNPEIYLNDQVLDGRPIHLYFGRELNELKVTPEMLEATKDFPRQIIRCTNWADLAKYLKLFPPSICFSYTELNYSSAFEIVNMVNTMSKLVTPHHGAHEHQIAIAVAVGKSTPVQAIKLLQKSDVLGIVPRPCEYGMEETVRGLNALWAGIPYWPKHIISELPGYRRRVSVHANTKLTPRQQQIFDLVSERGLSNKSIARTLNITESTVKLHMGKLFQKFGVKSRTQLVAFNRSKSKEEV